MDTFGRVVATILALGATAFVGLIGFTLVTPFANDMPNVQSLGRVIVALLTWFVGRWFWKLIWKRDTSDT